MKLSLQRIVAKINIIKRLQIFSVNREPYEKIFTLFFFKFRFSAKLLERVCAAMGGRRVAALLVCGGGSAAAAVVTAATRAGVPVLRASPSHLQFSYTIANVSYSVNILEQAFIYLKDLGV